MLSSIDGIVLKVNGKTIDLDYDLGDVPETLTIARSTVTNSPTNVF